MKNFKMARRSFLFAAMAMFLTLAGGCDLSSSSSLDGDNNTDGGDNGAPPAADNAFVGNWRITKEGLPAAWVFRADGTFTKYRANEPLGGALHFNGRYSVSNGALTGSFTNPGVGNGEIKARIDAEGKMQMDFIEFWHSPAKVVPCVGVRL